MQTPSADIEMAIDCHSDELSPSLSWAQLPDAAESEECSHAGVHDAVRRRHNATVMPSVTGVSSEGRIAVEGTSAGGLLAAALVHRCPPRIIFPLMSLPIQQFELHVLTWRS
jgi:hypothetical protein